jgi:hypothetical protein
MDSILPFSCFGLIPLPGWLLMSKLINSYGDCKGKFFTKGGERMTSENSPWGFEEGVSCVVKDECLSNDGGL